MATNWSQTIKKILNQKKYLSFNQQKRMGFSAGKSDLILWIWDKKETQPLLPFHIKAVITWQKSQSITIGTGRPNLYNQSSIMAVHCYHYSFANTCLYHSDMFKVQSCIKSLLRKVYNQERTFDCSNNGHAVYESSELLRAIIFLRKLKVRWVFPN